MNDIQAAFIMSFPLLRKNSSMAPHCLWHCTVKALMF